MRILVLTSSYPRWEGDFAGNFVRELSEESAAAGHDVLVLAPHFEGASSPEASHGVRVRRVPYFYPHSLQRLCYGGGVLENIRCDALARLQAVTYSVSLLIHCIAYGRKADLVHAHWALPQGLAAFALKKLFGKPYVVSVHAADVFAARSKVVRWLLHRVFAGAQTVTANSRATFDEVKSICDSAVLERIPMGVRVSKFKANVRERSERPCILYVGRLSHKKGVEHLIKAHKILCEELDSDLVIVGDGPRRRFLEDVAESEGVPDRVTFVGEVPHSELGSYYAGADVFVLPSVYDPSGDTEGLGVVLLEAMSSCVPVVASRIGGITDIVEDEVNGLLAEPGNPEEIASSLKKILCDRELGDRLSCTGFERVRKSFDWIHVGSRFNSIYRVVQDAG